MIIMLRNLLIFLGPALDLAVGHKGRSVPGHFWRFYHYSVDGIIITRGGMVIKGDY